MDQGKNRIEKGNIFASIPTELESEAFDLLAAHGDVRIERIVSKGHASPESGWYDQDQNEWVIVLRGEAIVTLEDSKEVHLKAGDHLNIPAHTKHKVTWTSPDTETVWIAVHY